MIKKYWKYCKIDIVLLVLWAITAGVYTAGAIIEKDLTVLPNALAATYIVLAELQIIDYKFKERSKEIPF